jgi:hypothetical protein
MGYARRLGIANADFGNALRFVAMDSDLLHLAGFLTVLALCLLALVFRFWR